MRVLLVANSEFMIRNFRSDLIEALQAKYEVRICYIGMNIAEEKYGTDKHYYSTKNKSRVLTYVKHFLMIGKGIKEFKPDIILSFTPISNMLTYIHSFFHVFHWLPNISGRGRYFNGRIGDLFIKYVFKRADVTFTQNKSETDYFNGLGYNVKCLPGSGINLSRYNNVAIRNLIEPIKFVFVGRFVPLKGLSLVLDTFNDLIEKNEVEAELHIYGGIQNGGCEKLYNRVLSEAKKDRVFYHGWCENVTKELNGNYNFLMFLSQYGEGTPKSLIEAGSLGIVSIVLNNCGSTDIITDEYNGFVVKKPVRALVLETMLKACLLSPAEYQTMAHNAITNVVQNYDVKIVNKLVFEEIGKINNDRCE